MLKKISSVILFVMIIVSLFCLKVTLAVSDRPCLQITKTVNNNKPKPGEVLNFVYKVTNIGNVELSNIMVTENLIDSIAPSSVLKLMPGETVAFYGTLTVPIDAKVGSAISNSAVATGFYNSRQITTKPCTLMFIILGQVTPSLPSVDLPYINNTEILTVLPDVDISMYPHLPSTGEDRRFLFWFK